MGKGLHSQLCGFKVACWNIHHVLKSTCVCIEHDSSHSVLNLHYGLCYSRSNLGLANEPFHVKDNKIIVNTALQVTPVAEGQKRTRPASLSHFPEVVTPYSDANERAKLLVIYATTVVKIKGIKGQNKRNRYGLCKNIYSKWYGCSEPEAETTTYSVLTSFYCSLFHNLVKPKILRRNQGLNWTVDLENGYNPGKINQYFEK